MVKIGEVSSYGPNILRLALLLAAATTISLMGCATSNQKPAETTTAAQTQEAKAETEQTEKAEGAKETESQEAEPENGEYAVQPRSIKDRTLKVGLIPVKRASGSRIVPGGI